MKETFIVFETGKEEKGVVLSVLGITISDKEASHQASPQPPLPTLNANLCHACPCSTQLPPQFEVLESFSPW